MPENITRRQVIKAAGAGTLGVTVGSQTAGARPEDRHIVGVEPGQTDVARRRADEVYRVLDFGDIGEAVAGWFSEEALDGLQNNPNVRYIERDGEMHALAQTLPWGIDRVDADVAHANGETGKGADIAIIDTGIDDDHPDLQANVGAGKAYVSCRGSNCNYAWSDDNDHGTHCAGIADAVNNSEGVVGVSTEATLHAVKVLDKRGSGTYSDVAAGIEYTADQGWDVGSLSLGGSQSNVVSDACTYAYDKGVLLVAAAGNDGPCSDCVGYPAAEPECIAVSATSEDDSLASFSSTGPEVELAAPGEDVYSTVIGGYDTFDGTSMACPHVSGAASQLMANGYDHATNVEFTDDDELTTDSYQDPGGARGQLRDTAENLGLGGDPGLENTDQGFGLLDVEAALRLAELSVDRLSAEEVETSSSDAEFNVEWEVSDPDGDLDNVDLVLTDLDDNEEKDTKTIDVSNEGDTASGTTRLVASGDEGSSNSYEVEATVTDSDGNTASETTTVSETEDIPTVDSLSLEEVEEDDTENNAEFDADWSVSDDDGDLDSLVLTLTDQDDNDDAEDTASIDISDSGSASGTTRLVAKGDDGSGHKYEVEAVVSDTDGSTNSDTATETESEDTSDGGEPKIDQFELTDDSNPAWTRYYVDWAVSDGDGDLSSVKSEMRDSSENVLDSDSSSVSGSNDSGTHYLESKSDATDIRLTVTDEVGNSTSQTKSI